MIQHDGIIKLMEAGVVLLVGVILLSPLVNGKVTNIGPSGLTIKDVDSDKGFYYYSESQIEKRDYKNLSDSYDSLLSRKSEMEDTIEILNSRLNATKHELTETKQKFEETKEKLDKTQDELSNTEKELNSTKQNLSGLRSELKNIWESGYIDFKPELKEVKRFLKENKVNKIKYSEDDFDCLNFAHKLMIDMRKQSLYACKAYVEFENSSAHSIVAVNTENNGTIYIEPKDEQILYELKAGEDFCERVGWNCNWGIKRVVDCWNRD